MPEPWPAERPCFGLLVTCHSSLVTRHLSVLLRPGAAVILDSFVPHQHGKREEDRGHHGDQVEVGCKRLSPEEVRGGIERSEPEGDDPARHELDEDVVNGERIAAEGEHVEYRRHYAHPVFKPERNSGEDEKHRKINHRAASYHE